MMSGWMLNKSDCMEEFQQAHTHIVHDVLCMNASCVQSVYYKHHAVDAVMQELKREAEHTDVLVEVLHCSFTRARAK
jgi:hypothetical protein